MEKVYEIGKISCKVDFITETEIKHGIEYEK